MQTIIILDHGSQYTQLIARKVRELNVYCEIHPYNNLPAFDKNVVGVILSGSPYSVNDKDAPKPDLWFKGKLPVLGICYGAQYMVNAFGGKVQRSTAREYGRAILTAIDSTCPLMKDVSIGSQVWASHGDTVETMPDNYKIICSTASVKNAGYKIEGEETYAIQFHPEVHHSVEGKKILENFLVNICHCKQDWTSDNFVATAINELKEKIGNDKVVLGLSGGVDSSVAAILLNEAAGKNLNCIFVDNGLLRKNEFESVLVSYKGMGLNVKGVDAKEMFYTALKGIKDPEAKRRAIGKTFIDVFDREASMIKDVRWLAQGTIYPDVIESISVKGPSATIKSHHNVGGLPDYMKLKIVEPLRSLFKDEVRRVGKVLGLKDELLSRHPFPGPGLAIRILSDVTEEKVRILQEVDSIFIEGLKQNDLYGKVWQAGAMLLPVQSVGVMGDERTYENVVALRAVESVDGMTADWAHLPYTFLAEVSNKIINNVSGVNRVCYDISSKPPATIEWE
ncbi:MAG: glutamine-hydrolyzing GMP synthase [Bacteroidales bacterium]|jgi:GMP synthase (glutamine-hydrolysing)|nr:glutamine-hydrolyzing GMP synthase [Bacteroidales bacterium]